MKQTVADIAQRFAGADEEQFAVLQRAFGDDPRKGVQKALARARHRLDAEAEERDRVAQLYRFQQEAAWTVVTHREKKDQAAAWADSLSKDADSNQELSTPSPRSAAETAMPPRPDSWICAVGLDEVGRGPLAGPLTIGAVVLPPTPHIIGLNDSKQLTPARREQLDAVIRQTALAWDIEHIPPQEIDERGMSACLKTAFSRAIVAIDAKIAAFDPSSPVRAVLIDGNPLHIDDREVNIVKGDARVAAISAASIIAKVARDRLMVGYAAQYPQYGFDANKGYGSAEHIAAIERVGLCPIHRKTFCQHFSQETLF